jgi:hypothetical protein
MSKRRQYIDFKLRLRDFDSETGAYKVEVDSRIGETQQPAPVTLNYPALKTVLSRLNAKRSIGADRLIEFGTALADRLLPEGEVRDLLRAALRAAGPDGGVRLRLLTDSATLAQLPWEFTYLQLHGGEPGRNHFLLLNPQISMVRHPLLPEERRPLTGATPDRLRLVVATANVDGEHQLDLDFEAETIETALANLNVDGVTIEWQPIIRDATRDALAARLQQGADLFHFAGHGAFAKNNRGPQAGASTGTGYLVLRKSADDGTHVWIPADEVARLLQGAGVRVAVLGACESGRRDGVNTWTGIAPALIERGVSAVVGMQYRVLDPHAVAFSRMFYTALAGGLSVDEAVAAGRQAMLSGPFKHHLEWGIPVLYMRAPDGVIFPELTVRDAPTANRIREVIEQTVETITAGGRVHGLDIRIGDGASDVEVKIVQKADTVEGDLTGGTLNLGSSQ